MSAVVLQEVVCFMCMPNVESFETTKNVTGLKYIYLAIIIVLKIERLSDEDLQH